MTVSLRLSVKERKKRAWGAVFVNSGNVRNKEVQML